MRLNTLDDEFYEPYASEPPRTTGSALSASSRYDDEACMLDLRLALGKGSHWGIEHDFPRLPRRPRPPMPYDLFLTSLANEQRIKRGHIMYRFDFSWLV